MTENSAETKKDRAYNRKEVKDIIQSVLSQIDKHAEPTAILYNELKKLEDHIENMRSELAQLRSIEISHNHIPAASDELDAVVEETAQATGSIMDACEKIGEVASKITDEATKSILENSVTSIYESCSFQDITGQRISKVVRTLKSIENKVHDILVAIGNDENAQMSPKEENKTLTNGPQLKGGGATQEEIDAILASFG